MSWGEWANRCMTYQGFPSASEGAIVGINGGMWGKTDNSNIDVSEGSLSKDHGKTPVLSCGVCYRHKRSSFDALVFYLRFGMCVKYFNV